MRRLRPGGDIILTIRGLAPATCRLLSADGEELRVLDASDPGLPKAVRKTLLELAADRPFLLLAARSGELHLPRNVRVNPAGIFLEQQRVAGLDAVIRIVPRAQVVDIRVRRKHVGVHSRRGLLIGAAIGAGVAAAYGATSEPDEALPLAGFGALVGGVYGLEFGTIVGVLAPRSPDVIYHVD